MVERKGVSDLSGIKTGTYEDAERRRAGWKGCEKLQNAEIWFSHVEVVVSSALLTAELLQSPPLCTIGRMLNQRSQERLREGQKAKVKSMNCSANLSLEESFSIPMCTKTPKTVRLLHFRVQQNKPYWFVAGERKLFTLASPLFDKHWLHSSDNLQLFRFIVCKVCRLLIDASECINQNCLDIEVTWLFYPPIKKYIGWDLLCCKCFIRQINC